ncbi:PAS/PAC sensor signal transduction histidine kinase [Leptolyngbya sp. NIES-3755]|nr:PAS/PAC sensor signal transduction histidine kinase [Leptolyngbya sp. NIES-3755]
MKAFDTTVLSGYIHTVQGRAQALYETTKDEENSPNSASINLETCLEELFSALEELSIAEEELRQQNEMLAVAQSDIETERQRYQELFEFAPDAYLVTDLYGVIREANRIAVRLFNVTHRHLTQKPLANFITEDQRQAFRSVLNQLPTIQRVQEWEVMARGRNNEPFMAAITVETVLDRAGEPTALRWLIRDITSRKRSEAQLQAVQVQNVELIEADRLKDQFMATISHELRTPLNAILGFSRLLGDRIAPFGDDRATQMNDHVLRNSRHLLAMIEELLDFARLKSRRLELQPTGFDLIQIAHETLQDLRCLSDQKGLALELDQLQESISIVNDPGRIRQILINLVSNAIKFTDSGRVTVGVWEVPEGRVLIAVQDTGIGIDPVDQANIFKEFWQVNQSHSRRAGGTGLGLAIVSALVELMQGTISIQSAVNEGTTIRVELPRRITSL